MADPRYRHPTPDSWDYRVGSVYVPARFAQMRCEVAGCTWQAIRTPRIVVPSRTPFEPGMGEPLRMMTTLTFCDPHRGRCEDIEAFLAAEGVKAGFEAMAKKRRPHGWRPDFAAARLEWLLTTTPQYRKFTARLAYNRAVKAEAGVL